MSNREWALAEIKRDRENIEELKEAKRDAIKAGRPDITAMLQSDIRELKKGIMAIEDIFLKEDNECTIS